MSKQILVSPSILACDFSDIKSVCKNLGEYKADMIHCDVMDGVFVPNITFGMGIVKCFNDYSDIPLDVHLMIVEPEKYIPQFIDVGAQLITFHPTACKDIGKTLDYIKSRGVKCGLALNPDHSLDEVVPYLDKLDVLMLMSVYAGFGGQKFIPDTVAKVKEAKRLVKPNTLIEVDGGITLDNAKEVALAGADILVAGSAVFKSDNPAHIVSGIQNCLD